MKYNYKIRSIYRKISAFCHIFIEKYVDTIGNLTLTAYNSELQNKPFEEKKDIYIQSKLFLNSNLENYHCWKGNEIKDRAELLAERALEIWEEPKTEYIEKEDENLIYDLSDTGISFINTKIVAFRLFDKEYEVTSWRDFQRKIISFLYDLDKKPLLKLVEKYSEDTEYNSKKFSNDETKLRAAIKIDDNIYAESHYNSDNLVDAVRLVIETYGLDLNEVEVKLKENNVSKKGVYDLKTLSRNCKPELKQMFEKIDKMIVKLDPNIEKIYTKHYLAYRKGQNFIEMHFHIDWLTLYMFPNAKYEDERNKIEFLENKTWTLTARMMIRPEDDIDYIMKIIKADYEVL